MGTTKVITGLYDLRLHMQPLDLQIGGTIEQSREKCIEYRITQEDVFFSGCVVNFEYFSAC